jgi:hypothetical protein
MDSILKHQLGARVQHIEIFNSQNVEAAKLKKNLNVTKSVCMYRDGIFSYTFNVVVCVVL